MVGVEWDGNDTINIYINGKRVHNKSKSEILTGDDVPVIS